MDPIIKRFLSLASELNVTEDLKEITKTYVWVKACLNDAEKRQIRDESVREWLHDLRVLADEMEALMDEYEFQKLAEECLHESEASSSFVTPRMLSIEEFANRVRKLDKEFWNIAKRRDALQLTEAVGSRTFDDPFVDRSACGSIPGDRIFLGRENELRQLELLLCESSNDCDNIEVVAVIGMGGVGKTTLAQHVYNYPVIETSFRRGWVSVAERFDVALLLKAAIESLSESTCKFTEVSALQVELRKLVENTEKVLLVLDDVWNEDSEKWDNFFAPFLCKAKRGSKILLTTRDENVARISGVVNFIRLKELTEDEGWSLLREHGFRRGAQIYISEEIKQMGKEIVRKCQGLPLAIKVLGGLLNSMGSHQEDSWKYVLEKNLSELEYGEGGKRILGSLYLSYLHLRPQLKTCFRFCSIYSRLRLPRKGIEYFTSEKHLLLNLELFWMCFDIVKNERDAESCLQELKSRCFLELVGGKYVSMHDLLHDLAEYVFKDKHVFIFGIPYTGNKGSSNLESWHASGIGKTYEIAEADKNQNKLRSLRFAVFSKSIMSEACLDVGPKFQALFMNGTAIGKSEFVLCGGSLEGLKRLRMLSLDSRIITSRLGYRKISVNSLPQEIFHLYNLRYLKLTYSGIRFLPDSVGNMRNLRWLNLAHNPEMGNLPESISRLVNLQQLDVFGTSMDSFPAGITNLTNLRRLYFQKDSFSHMPTGFGNLRKLQYLPVFKAGSSAGQASIAELKHLVDLKDEVRLEKLGLVKSAADAKEAGTKDKEHIRRLHLSWGWEWEAVASLKEQVINCLRPHRNLEELVVSEYEGSKLPYWMGDDSFTKLAHVTLLYVLYCTSLSPIDQLPSLVHLGVMGMRNLSQLVRDHNDGSLPANTERRKPFPRLQTLSIHVCDNLRFLSLHDFAALTMVEVAHCNNLEGMDPPSNNVLELVTIKNCPRFCYTTNPARHQAWELRCDSNRRRPA